MPDSPRASTWAYLDQPPPLPMAHRGGARHPEIEGLENTMTAFRHAVALGYTYLETDVHVTSDGVLLAFHDDVLDRVTDRTGDVAARTHDEVRQAVVAQHEHVPTLDELVRAFPDARFNIDLKSAGAVTALAAYVEARGLHERVLVGSFSPGRLRAFRRLTGGRVATSAHPWEVAAFVLLPGPLAKRLAPAPAALQVPHRYGPVLVAGSRFVRRAHAGGRQVHVWTIDDPEEISVLLDRGVDGIFTDRTDILRDVLRSRGQWRES